MSELFQLYCSKQQVQLPVHELLVKNGMVVAVVVVCVSCKCVVKVTH